MELLASCGPMGIGALIFAAGVLLGAKLMYRKQGGEGPLVRSEPAGADVVKMAEQG